jgi:hypothetical protein
VAHGIVPCTVRKNHGQDHKQHRRTQPEPDHNTQRKAPTQSVGGRANDNQ